MIPVLAERIVCLLLQFGCFVYYLHFLPPPDVAGCCDVILRSVCLSSGCVWMCLIFACVLCNESVENRVNERHILSVSTFAVQ
jgi:hypothetical protein